MSCGSSKKTRRFGGVYHLQGHNILSLPSSQRRRASRRTTKRASCNGTSVLVSFKTYPAKQRPINDSSTVTDWHDRGGAVTWGSLRRSSWGISSLRKRKEDEKSVCIRKVLRPTNSIKVFRGFPWSQSNCWVGSQFPRCSVCFTCSPPNGNFKIFV
jgi:hypothetical protein